VVGLEDRKRGHCGQLYRNLTAKIDNLDPYYEFVACARQNVTPGIMKAADGSGLTLRLLGKAKAWAVDGLYDRLKRDEFGPVFHRGVKPRFNRKQIEKYHLNAALIQSILTDVKMARRDVSCGGHYAPNCTMCITDQETGAWVGENWCNGDCFWSDGFSILRELQQ